MEASSFENLLNIDSDSEESKSLSPLTYYHPFQSSFDPNFGQRTSIDGEKPANATGDFVASQWTNEPVGRKLTGRSYFKSWEDEISKPNFDTESQMETADTSFGSFTRNSFSPQRTFPSASSTPNRLPNDFSLFDSKFLVPYHLDPVRQRNRVPGVNFPAFKYEITGSNNLGLKNVFQSSVQTLLPTARNSDFLNPNGRKVCQRNENRGRNMICNFCKNNKEVPDIYMNHYLHDPCTKKLSCPVLRKHVCEICGETGDRAHTLQYCPVNKERGLQAKIPILLKTRTITNSTGKIRRN